MLRANRDTKKMEEMWDFESCHSPFDFKYLKYLSQSKPNQYEHVGGVLESSGEIVQSLEIYTYWGF